MRGERRDVRGAGVLRLRPGHQLPHAALPRDMVGALGACGDGETAPPYSMGTFSESTVPGCRAPHFWLGDGQSVYDAFGPGYTLLCFSSAADADPLREAASARGMPLVVLDVDREATRVPGAYVHAMVLCRPDQHVAWRGDRLPHPIQPLVDALRGAAKASPKA